MEHQGMSEALQRLIERSRAVEDAMSPAERDNMHANQRIGLIAVEMLPDPREGGRYHQVALDWLDGLVQALSDEECQITKHQLGADIRQLTGAHRRDVRSRVRGYAATYRAGLMAQEDVGPDA